MCGLNELIAILSLVGFAVAALYAVPSALLEWLRPDWRVTVRLRTYDNATTLAIWLFLGGAIGLAATHAFRLIWFSAGC
jgi:hypothetical protein